MQRKIANEAEITEQALIKLIKITEFLVWQHLAHTTNYESFVDFIGCELKEKVSEEYLKFSKVHKYATYLSQTSLSIFLYVIGDWMPDETLKGVKTANTSL